MTIDFTEIENKRGEKRKKERKEKENYEDVNIYFM